MYIIPINNRPTVGLIRQESEAYKSGLRQGDVILKVDGRDIPSITIFQRLRFVSGQSYTYTVRDKQGRIKEVRLKKE